MKYQQWNITTRPDGAYRTLRDQGMPALVAAALCARGVEDLAQARALLASGADQLRDPFLMKDMDRAAARVERALETGEKIAVYGDYDVDGITSTCLLTHYLRTRGARVEYYIPDRLDEGYGVNPPAVRALAERRTTPLCTRYIPYSAAAGSALASRSQSSMEGDCFAISAASLSRLHGFSQGQFSIEARAFQAGTTAESLLPPGAWKPPGRLSKRRRCHFPPKTV